MRSRYDAIVIGAGHNGLVAAAYLARAGWSVLVLERRPAVGGACVTEEVFPGCRVSTAAYLVSLLQAKIVQELELAGHGYRVFPKDPAYFSPFPDGSYFFMWQDQTRTCREIARFSPRDAERYPAYEAWMERLAGFVEPMLLQSPPNLPPSTVGDWLSLGRLGLAATRLGATDLADLLRLLTSSVQDVLERWFESEPLNVALATDGVIGTNGGPRTPGTGYVLLHHSMGGVASKRGLWGFVEGGMGGISQALARAAEAHGAEILTEAEVSRIVVRHGRSVGVAMEDGTEYLAGVVLSNADPKRTFLQLVEPGELEDGFRHQVKAIKCEGSSLKINLSLSELPSFRAYPGKELGPQHRGTIHLCPDLEYMERAWDDAKYGHPSASPMVEITIPTAYQQDLAPPGMHLMSLFVQYAPYGLAQGSWDDERERFADRVIDVLCDYAPNVRRAILGRHVLSPLDLEREYGMTGGNIFHGEMSLDQLFSLRPVAGWARYATPIKNLYLCGSGTHPGGGVMGAPGHNAAMEVLRRGRQ